MLTPFPGPDGEVPLTCQCGQEANAPTKGSATMIAVVGMGIVFDTPSFPPPAGFLPKEIQCRRCGRIYTWGDNTPTVNDQPSMTATTPTP